ncbi:unnamed protein product [Linum trigynum]|uniref:Uncharacterized protein n=1 Tax=Linum trigynum TaxID=586398 RepID=A0AAV2D9R4_9ROSI
MRLFVLGSSWCFLRGKRQVVRVLVFLKFSCIMNMEASLEAIRNQLENIARAQEEQTARLVEQATRMEAVETRLQHPVVVTK